MLRARVAIHCTLCGKDSFRGPTNPGPKDLMLCTGCGMQIPYGELERDAIARAKRLREARAAGRGFGRS
jgi:hypothetical protein